MVVGVLLLPWQWHIPSILSETGQGTSTETYGLGNMFTPDDHLERHFKTVDQIEAKFGGTTHLTKSSASVMMECFLKKGKWHLQP